MLNASEPLNAVRGPRNRSLAVRCAATIAFAAVLAAVSCAQAACGRRGELFIVAHFTCPVDSISMEQCSGILDGTIKDFGGLGWKGGPAIRLLTDGQIAGPFAESFPAARARTARFDTDDSLAADR